MILDLLHVIRDRAAALPELANADVRILLNPRFDSLPEDRTQVVVSPVSQMYEESARDIVVEKTSVLLSIARYYANNFNESDELGLLAVVPAIEMAFFRADVQTEDALYRWNSTVAIAQPYERSLAEIPGGMLDGQATDAFVYQVPVLLRFERYLQARRDVIVSAPPLLTLDYSASDVRAARIIAAEDFVGRLAIMRDGQSITAELERDGVLVYASL